MTCAHVLALIDAGPFAAYPRADLDAAHGHALDCPTCAPAWTMMRELEADLGALDEPSPPPDLTTAVLSRIADSQAVAEKILQREASVSGWQRWPAWVGALGGAAALVAIQSVAATDVTVFAPRGGGVSASLIDFPPAGPGVLVLAIGLVLYAKGLFSLASSVSPARRGAAGDTGSAPR